MGDSSLLAGKVAVITGSTRGIGEAVAAEFVRHGGRVIVTGRNDSDVSQVVHRFGSAAAGVCGDMRDETWPTRLLDFAVEAFGKVDIFVNNSGIPVSGPVAEINDDDIDKALAVNLASFIRCAREAAAQLTENRGVLINMSSVFGLSGRKNYAVYSATKAATIGLTRSLALEWASLGVRVNCIAPGYIATRVNLEAREDESLSRRLLAEIPLGRFGEPREVANAALFLASPMASYISGQTLVVDGGFSVA